VKVQPGEKVSVSLKNEGDETHTFTSDSLNIDKTVAPGKSAKVTVTVPTDGNRVRVPLQLPPEHGDAGRVLHQAGRHRGPSRRDLAGAT